MSVNASYDIASGTCPPFVPVGHRLIAAMHTFTSTRVLLVLGYLCLLGSAPAASLIYGVIAARLFSEKLSSIAQIGFVGVHPFSTGVEAVSSTTYALYEMYDGTIMPLAPDASPSFVAFQGDRPRGPCGYLTISRTRAWWPGSGGYPGGYSRDRPVIDIAAAFFEITDVNSSDSLDRGALEQWVMANRHRVDVYELWTFPPREIDDALPSKTKTVYWSRMPLLILHQNPTFFVGHILAVFALMLAHVTFVRTTNARRDKWYLTGFCPQCRYPVLDTLSSMEMHHCSECGFVLRRRIDSNQLDDDHGSATN